MEGSCNPNMEAELADAMKSDRSSSSSCSSYENVSNVSDLEDSSRLEPGSTEYVSARITGNEIYDESGKRLCEANIVVNETRSKAPINAVEDSKVNEEMNYLRDSEKPEKSDSINEPASGKVAQKLDINKRIFSDTGISQTCHTKSKYDNLKVTRKNKQWVLSDGKTENILSEFNEEDGVVLNICDDDVYLQAHDKLYEVYIGTDGKTVVTQIQEGTIVCQTAPDEAATKVRDQKSKDAQTISNESMDADETHVVDNKCLDDAYKQEGLPSNDQVADQELKGDGNIGVFLAKDAVHTRKLQSNEQTFPDKKCNKPSHDDTKYDRVKVTKKNKQWLLSDGKTEYILSEFNEEDDITLNVCDDDIYLQTDDQLFEVTFDTDGKIVVTQIQEGTIVCQPPSGGAATKERNKKSDAQVAENDSGSIEESRVLGNESKSRNSFDAADKEKPFPSDFMKIDGSNATLLSKEEMTHLQEQDLKRATSSNSVPDAVLNLEDLFKKMDIKHGVDVDSSSVKENDIGKDSRKNTNLQKADEQSSRAASIKTNKNAEVSFTHIGSQTYTGGTGPRSALQSNFVGYSSYSDGLHMTAPLHMTDNATMENVNAKTEEKHFNKDTGARPKQPTGKTVQNNEDANRSRNSAEDSLFENKNTMGDALFRKEYGPDGCRTAFQALKESDDGKV